MFIIQFHDNSNVLAIDAYSFVLDDTSNALIFKNESSEIIGFYDRSIVRSVFWNGLPELAMKEV